MSTVTFPSLMNSLVRPNTKNITQGIHLHMLGNTSEGSNTVEFMGFTEGDVKFILDSFTFLEDSIFFPVSGEVNWLDAATSFYKAIPENINESPAFKQVFTYFFEAFEQQNIDMLKSLMQEVADIIYIKDYDDKNTYYVAPEEIFSTEMPSGVRKQRFY